MTIVVNPHNEQEEKVLLAFLESLKYEYQTNDIEITTEQQKEILRRDKSFAEGKTTARNWEEIKKELESVYR
ncbi:MAG: addiction module protein [Mucilaginibacter sp.]|uniref:addiction module protein n=1 Tax=Mucilaginibacter sp. TaxID=1882438 RepID=UPI003266BE1F